MQDLLLLVWVDFSFMKIKKYKLKYSKKDISFVKDEIEKSLKLGYLTDGGPNISKFESLWCKFNNSKNAIAQIKGFYSGILWIINNEEKL